ncbi:MAG: hypothetical protein KC731_14855, partial [Myxococcales bacterium]|nr:hypothetical protein [Myxococcales bacterium]
VAAAAVIDAGMPAARPEDAQYYRWTFALLGAELERPPQAASSDGPLLPGEVLEQLLGSEPLRFAPRTEASAWTERVIFEGEDDGLLATLRRRGAGDRLDRLTSPAREVIDEALLPLPAAPPTSVALAPRGETDPEEPLVDPWLSGFVSRMRRWLTGAPAPQPAPRSLRLVLEQAVEELGTSSAEIHHIGFSRRGRPIRYQLEEHRLVVNRDHPTVAAWVDGDRFRSPSTRRLFLAAVLSELNRAYQSVTAATEMQLLVELMQRQD